ncbi:MAG: ABC-2 family transporter protein [Oscillospiraceae bacterium]|nr:ABC-2 family transporter protein [Oscillospiraceae bacterium]
MKKHLKILKCYFRLNLASAVEYRASFISQAFGMALSNSTFIFFWWIAFSQLGGNIADYSFLDVIFIWAVTSTGYGLSKIFFANASRITQLISTGELDTYLLQPCNILLSVISAGTTLTAYGDFCYGIILMAIGYTRDIYAWGWFIVGVFIYGILLTAITVFTHSLSFYMGDATVLGALSTEFAINFAIYPEKIYAPLIRTLMYSLVPVGIAVHIPLSLYREFSFEVTLAAVVTVIGYCCFTYWFFGRGLKRYESGNMIATRI